MGRMIDWKRKKFWLEQETGQVHIGLKNTSTTRKTTAGEKKGMGYIAPTTGYYPRNG